MTDDFLITAEELAEKMRVHVETIRRQTRAKQIPFHSIGRQTRYRLSEVLAATQQGAVDAD